MGENGNGDYDKSFYREILKKQIEISEKTNEIIQEHGEILVEVKSVLNEIKIALQSKPCIVKEKTEELKRVMQVNENSTYKWIIGSLLVLITGILTAFGFYRH